MADGWIKLHSTIKNHWIFDNPEYLKAWVFILIEVNHKEPKGHSLNSIKEWANLFNFSVQTTRTFFKKLESDNLIKRELTQQLTKQSTKLTVLNINSYNVKATKQLTDQLTKVTVQKFVSENPDSRKVVVYFLDTLEEDSRYRPKTWATKLDWLKCAQWAINQMGEYGDEKVIDIIDHFRNGHADNGRFSWADNFNSITKLRKKNPEGTLYLDYFWEKAKEHFTYGPKNGES